MWGGEALYELRHIPSLKDGFFLQHKNSRGDQSQRVSVFHSFPSPDISHTLNDTSYVLERQMMHVWIVLMLTSEGSPEEYTETSEERVFRL